MGLSQARSEHGFPGSDWLPDCYLSSASLNRPTCLRGTDWTQMARSQHAPETEIQYIQNTNNSYMEAVSDSSM